MAHRLPRRLLLGSAATVAALAAGLGAVRATVALTPDPAMTHTGANLAVVSLTDDAPGALFPRTELAPGRTVRRCLAVRFTGAGADSQVRLIAENLSGRLLPYLAVTVAAGTGGGYGGCRGFTGTTIYDGPLTGLAGAPGGAPGVATGWQPTGAGTRTFAVTVRVADDDAAQAKSAGATLRWALVAPDAEPTNPAATPSTGTPTTTPPQPPRTSVPPHPSVPPRPTPSGPDAGPGTSVSPAGGPPSVPPSASVPSSGAGTGHGVPLPSPAAVPTASADRERSVAGMIRSAFSGGLSTLRDTAGSSGNLAVSAATLLLVLLLALVLLRWLRRRNERP